MSLFHGYCEVPTLCQHFNVLQSRPGRVESGSHRLQPLQPEPKQSSLPVGFCQVFSQGCKVDENSWGLLDFLDLWIYSYYVCILGLLFFKLVFCVLPSLLQKLVCMLHCVDLSRAQRCLHFSRLFNICSSKLLWY